MSNEGNNKDMMYERTRGRDKREIILSNHNMPQSYSFFKGIRWDSYLC